MALGLCLWGLWGGGAMTAPTDNRAGQRQYPVVALSCDADLRLCQALVQALSEMTPTHLYRINPKPIPPRAFDLRLEITTTGAARLRWQDGLGEIVPGVGHNTAEFAQHIVQASRALVKALKKP